MSANCQVEAVPRIRAPYPYFNAVKYDRLKASGMPIAEGLPETGPYTTSLEISPESPFYSGLPPAPPTDTLPHRPSSGRNAVSDFIAESGYIRSLQNKCAGLHLPWKVDFSFTNRFLWTQTLTHAVLELLEEERIRSSKSIDQQGVDRFAEIVEYTIFHYMAEDPPAYGNLMAAKYDSLRYGDLLQEERKLLQHFAWL